MAIDTIKYALLCTFTMVMVSLNGINGQLKIDVASVPDNINTLLENISDTSTLTYGSQIRMENTHSQMANTLTDVANHLQMQSELLQNNTSTMAHMIELFNAQIRFLSQVSADNAIDCSDLASRGPFPSGSYNIRSWDNLGRFRVYCDMDTDNGGWTVFQKRFDGSVDFYLGWDDYERGFGSPDGEYWMGLREIYRLTQQGSWKLRIDLEDYQGNIAYAEYSMFSVGDKASFYRLSIGVYSGTAGDGMSSLNNQPFSTKDRDHDNHDSANCAQNRNGAMWYNRCACTDAECFYSNLNGWYQSKMTWYQWKNSFEVYKRSEMKIRRI